MKLVTRNLYQYEGNITSPSIKSIECFDCGRELHRTPGRFSGSVPSRGWYAVKIGRGVTFRLCPRCGKQLAQQVKAER